jgi:hypothetical protein
MRMSILLGMVEKSFSTEAVSVMSVARGMNFVFGYLALRSEVVDSRRERVRETR